MDAQKRNILLHEIEHWRRSKLLPEQYCDFLYNLYTDKEETSGHVIESSAKKIRESRPKVWIFISLACALISILSVHFLHLSWEIQAGIAGLTGLGLYVYGWVKKDTQPLFAQMMIGISFIGVMLFGLHILNQLETEGSIPSWVKGAWLVCCCLWWMATGIAAKMPIFHFSGVAVLLLGYSWVLHQRFESETSWILIQGMWVPLSLLLIWVGWMFGMRIRSIGMVYIANGLILWFVPELYMLFIRDMITEVTQAVLLLKILITAVSLFMSRKKWTEWVVNS
ncbi:hypothetical protein [Marinicrinis sediminis]|uniref:DUF2157 domain-containing protein n=1 Tax=Marinicrinis sediminis TaxID=1652465 RepID=A0ABW5RBH4_9BACL